MNGVSYNPMNRRLTAGQKPFSYEVAKPQNDSSNQWSSTENNRNNARNVNFNSGNANNNNKYNGNVVRPVAASQDYDAPEAFVASVWEAYHDCLRGKMRSKQAVEYMEMADEDIPFKPNRFAHDGAVPRLHEDDGGERIGRMGYGLHATNPQLVLGLHAEA